MSGAIDSLNASVAAAAIAPTIRSGAAGLPDFSCSGRDAGKSCTGARKKLGCAYNELGRQGDSPSAFFLLAAAACVATTSPRPRTWRRRRLPATAARTWRAPATAVSVRQHRRRCRRRPTPRPPPGSRRRSISCRERQAQGEARAGEARDVEIKNDGIVNTAGKPTHKVTGMELQDKTARASLKVDGDNNVKKADGRTTPSSRATTHRHGRLGSSPSATTASRRRTRRARRRRSARLRASAPPRRRRPVVGWSVWGDKPPAAPEGREAGRQEGGRLPADKPADPKKPADKPAPKK